MDIEVSWEIQSEEHTEIATGYGWRLNPVAREWRCLPCFGTEGAHHFACPNKLPPPRQPLAGTSIHNQRMTDVHGGGGTWRGETYY